MRMRDYTLSWWENEDGAWKQRSATVSADSQSDAIVLVRRFLTPGMNVCCGGKEDNRRAHWPGCPHKEDT